MKPTEKTNLKKTDLEEYKENGQNQQKRNAKSLKTAAQTDILP